MRLFLGLPIPPELAQALARRTQAIELPKSRPTASENLHLTLVFLAEVPDPNLPPIDHELSELTFAPLQLNLPTLPPDHTHAPLPRPPPPKQNPPTPPPSPSP